MQQTTFYKMTHNPPNLEVHRFYCTLEIVVELEVRVLALSGLSTASRGLHYILNKP